MHIILALTLLSACGPSTLVTANEFAPRNRQPDGVLVDPEPVVPTPVARSDAKGIVTLREPTSDAVLFDVILRYFAAFSQRSETPLTSLLTSDATALGGTSRASRNALIEDWRMRVRSADFSAMRPEYVRVDRLERFNYDDLSALTEPRRPPDMHPDDLLIRVPVTSPIDKSGVKLFKDVVVMLLRHEKERLLIAGVLELDSP